jgi:hypothetical protein
VSGLSEEVEGELISLDDPVVVDGDWHELDVLAASRTEVHVDDAVEEDLIRRLHFPTPAPLLLEIQLNKLVVLEESVDVAVDHCLIQLVVSVLRVQFESTRVLNELTDEGKCK